MKTGTIAFQMFGSDPDWHRNNQEYAFGPIKEGSVAVAATKFADGTLEVRFTTKLFSHTFEGPMPAPTDSKSNKLHVAMTWNPEEVILFVDGARVNSAPFNPPVQ